jgi:hypothetical protein
MSAKLVLTNHQLSPGTNQEMLSLVEYWEARRHGLSLPTRRDIDVIDLRQWLSRVSLYEVHDDGDVRVRVRGSLKNEFSWHVRGGISLYVARPKCYSENAALHAKGTLAGQFPTRFKVDLDLDGFKFEYDRLALPLAAGGGLPAMVLTFAQFSPRRAGEFWIRYAQAEGLSVTSSALH